MQIKDNPALTNKAKPITFYPDDTIKAALDIMCSKNIGSIVVVNNDDKILGIVTERDMMIRVLYTGIDINSTPLKKIMSKEVKVAKESDNLVDWMHTMSNERFRHLPIVDKQEKLVSMMSQGDFVAYTWPELYERMKVNFKGRISNWFQVCLVGFAVITVVLVALKL